MRFNLSENSTFDWFYFKGWLPRVLIMGNRESHGKASATKGIVKFPPNQVIEICFQKQTNENPSNVCAFIIPIQINMLDKAGFGLFSLVNLC